VDVKHGLSGKWEKNEHAMRLFWNAMLREGLGFRVWVEQYAEENCVMRRAIVSTFHKGFIIRFIGSLNIILTLK
jgi:hypothetical protein